MVTCGKAKTLHLLGEYVVLQKPACGKAKMLQLLPEYEVLQNDQHMSGQ